MKDKLLLAIMFPAASLWLLVRWLFLTEIVSDTAGIIIALAPLGLKGACFVAYQVLKRK